MTRIVLALMWLLHWLPLRLLAPLGRTLGCALYVLGRRRRHVALTNLRLCFPQMAERQRRALACEHFKAFGRSFLERGLLWWASAERIRRIVRVEGAEHLDAVRDRPVILLVPHFVGLDMGWTRLTLDFAMVSIYANQSNLLFNAALYEGRMRFGDSLLLSRQEGTRKAIRAMKAGRPFYYLPDMDYGQRDTIFVPFFGVPAATITGLSRLARMCGAVVVPAVTRMEDDGYVVDIGAAWQDFPGASIAEDTRRMNAFIEDEVLKSAPQYFWLHRRFKTRPGGEKGVYCAAYSRFAAPVLEYDFPMFKNPDNDAIREILRTVKTVAVVGYSPKPDRPSYNVTRALQDFGYKIIPIRPMLAEGLGEKAYASLRDLPTAPDLVDVFRAPDAVDEIVDDCIAIGAKRLWLQETVINEAAAARAQAAGITVVMDLCIWKEYRRLLGKSS